MAATYITQVKKRRMFIALLIIALASVGGWQFALTRDYPMGNGEIIPAPDGKTYAAMVYLRKRSFFSQPKEYIAMEIGRGTYHQHPEVLHYSEREISSLKASDIQKLNQIPATQLITWTSNATVATFHLGNEDIKITLP
ncbi:MAG: hypothetical protein ACI97B_002063 [Verrucomicrobiales bacterium]|jgi:hypothetical protein